MPTIMLAEDEPQTAQLIQFKLKQAGFAVVHATDGEQALTLVAAARPDLIILDGLMPVFDGFEVLRRIKEDPRHRHIPVIMLTARSRDKDVVSGLELGAADYMVKPFSPSELLARVRKVLGPAAEPKVGEAAR
ncbi:MAG: response regulator [Verrucomicrobia bacterium]|nr:response regulator [Verrucomicrobiota bacterium]NBU07908.1 response regulator [Pseudomonadota bacterium]NDA65501.1 response regulator [Verrucomicrobiota bacterium]NDB74618.1 response regulator [Verrucomicrobiota bacterium]NDD37374.1 response regulator [Verrucomicrobiota bacterium]